MNLNIKQRAIEFFKKETNADQIVDNASIEIIRLMVMFAISEGNSELEVTNQELSENNTSLQGEISQLENKVDELNNDLAHGQSIIDGLEDVVKQKDLDATKLLKHCEEINLATLKLVDDYNILMDKFKESQTLLKDFFKSDIPENLN